MVEEEFLGVDQRPEHVLVALAPVGGLRAPVLALHVAGWRSYLAEPRRRHQRWEGQRAERNAVYANRRRVRRAKGKRWQRRRSELCERTFAHLCDSGGMRRTWIGGLVDVAKRYLFDRSSLYKVDPRRNTTGEAP